MAYVDGLLVTGETVVRREQQHWVLPFYTAGRWVALAFGVFVLALVVNWILPDGGDGLVGGVFGLLNGLLLLVTIVALAIAVAGFGWAVARWRSQEYVLTNQRVVHVQGVITKRSSDSVLETLNDAQVEVPLLGRVMGWGNLRLMTANESGNETMLALRDPVGFKKAVLSAKVERTVALNRPPRVAAPGTGVPPAPQAVPMRAPVAPPAIAAPARASGEDVTRTLSALAGLRDTGAITPEEYEAKKKELLDRI